MSDLVCPVAVELNIHGDLHVAAKGFVQSTQEAKQNRAVGEKRGVYAQRGRETRRQGEKERDSEGMRHTERRGRERRVREA